MLKLSSTLLNRPVISLVAGNQIAVATKPIVNPHNLKILGWWCTGAGGQQSVLIADEVRENLADGLVVNSEESLSEPADLVRHKDILEIDFALIDKLVRTKSQKLGKVNDYSYNDGYFVQKLYVARPLRKVFTSDDTLLIDREQILEVTDKYILVRDTEVKAGAEEFAGAPISA
jgi:hypothetical protein